MTRRFGIDTSILVRLLTGHPESDFKYCVGQLRDLLEQGCEIFASNQVIGEAYMAVQHHYGVSKAHARAAMLDVLSSGLVGSANGGAVLAALGARDEPGLFDHLITDDYSRTGLEVLTLDRRMARLDDARLL